MRRQLSYLDTQVLMVEKLCQIEMELDRTLGILLRRAWFDHDDAALNAARDRGMEIGNQMVGILCDKIANDPYRPRQAQPLAAAKITEGVE